MEQEEQRAESLPEETAHAEAETLRTEGETTEELPAEGRRRRREKKKKKELPFLLWLALLVVFVLVLRNFVLGTVYVKGSSMEPNFYHGDLVFMEKLSVRLGTPQRGDVVICRLDNTILGMLLDSSFLMGNRDSPFRCAMVTWPL